MRDTGARRGDARTGENPKQQWTAAPGAQRAARLFVAGLVILLVVCALLAWRISVLEGDVARLREEMKAPVPARTRPAPAAPTAPALPPAK
jgi:hypothetical protein